MSEFHYAPIFQLQEDRTEYRLLTSDYTESSVVVGRTILRVKPEGLRLLARQAMKDISFFLRSGHLEQLTAIVDDPQSSGNDRYVASTLLENAVEAAKEVLPSCQDTGTAIIIGHKGECVWTEADDRRSLSLGVHDTFTGESLRYSMMAPVTMFDEINTNCNLPAQIDLYACQGSEYHFLFLAKGGGSANKTFLYQETVSLLNEDSLISFCRQKLPLLGTSACPPYHIALVIGGTSAEENLKSVKMATTGYYDSLPTKGDQYGRAFRDKGWEDILLRIARETRIGAQFGGKYLAHDFRVIRLPRHAASVPVGLAVSCSADRHAKGKITKDGIFLEQLEKNPQRYWKSKKTVAVSTPVAIDLNRPMAEILSDLDGYHVGTLLHLNGPMIVARDIAHARIYHRLKEGQPMPDYFKEYPVYYAGPAKTPEGRISGSFGPTTAGRMDMYVDRFQAQGGSMIMLAKGNRSSVVTAACKEHGGFYLGSIGGPAAVLAQECILAVETIDFADLGMEAVRKIQVRNFPAFIVCDNKGNDLFEQFS